MFHEPACATDPGRVTNTKLQAALHEAFSPDAAIADPRRAVAACDLLVTAATSHPSLLGALLFPTKLRESTGVAATAGVPPDSGSGGGKRTKDGGRVAAGPGALALVGQVAADVGVGPGDRPGEWSKDACSALDGLWALLRRGEELRRGQPHLLAAVLRALVTLWQVSRPRHRVLHCLIRM